MAWAICSPDNDCLRLLPASRLAGGSSLLEAVADRSVVPRSIRHSVSSYPFVERAER
jgi:hypothetical protein